MRSYHMILFCMLVQLSAAVRSLNSNSMVTPSPYSRTSRTERIQEGTSTQTANRTYIRPCYFTNWSQYRKGCAKFTPDKYIPGLCTHILYAFAWMGNDSAIRAFDPADLPSEWSGIGMYAKVNLLKSIDPGLKTLLSVGGWSFGTKRFQEMAKNKTRRSLFVKSAIDFVREHDFDGIDIDWEYPRGADDITMYSMLMKDLHDAIGVDASLKQYDRLLLTAAVSASEPVMKEGYDIPNLAKHVDFILLMSYDFHGSWDNETGLHNALFAPRNSRGQSRNANIDWAANYWARKGMPRDKIIVGIATYGRGWTLKNITQNAIGSQGSASRATEMIGEQGIAAYYEVCEMLNNGAERRWQADSQVPYLVYGDQWLSYDDAESIMMKMEWLKRQHFGGAFVWTLDFDDFNGQCDSTDNAPYPLVGTIARELAGINIKHQVTETTTQSSTPSAPVTVPLRGQYQMPESRKRSVCSRMSDGFHPSAQSPNHFVLCLKGKTFGMMCPAGLRFNPRLGYCTDHIAT